MIEAVSKRLYSVKEAGRYLGRSPWTIRRLIRDGVLREVRQGRRVMVDLVDMDLFIEKHKREAIDGHDLPQEEERSNHGTFGGNRSALDEVL
jgi:excisionase family DNA binding protein